MTEQTLKIRHWLTPLSWLYGLGVCLRNKLFDWGWLRSKSFCVPVICIGNLTAGGTGKTPHTEYLVKLLQQSGLQVAILSRGYKRKTKGYQLATSHSTAEQIGDEPCQMKHKFPKAHVAVDANRCQGIEQLCRLATPCPDVILLDDAFQHRYVNAGLNILLTDYNRLFCDDRLLPVGLLREPTSGKNRAHMVIVTKCPKDIKPIDFNITTKRLNLYPYQQLYFTQVRYGSPIPLFPELVKKRGTKEIVINGSWQILLVTGIASPRPLLDEIRTYNPDVTLLAFPDHHNFTSKDLRLIEEKFKHLAEGRRMLITTEKDAARLKSHPAFPAALKPFIYVLPIEIEFLLNQKEIFNQNVLKYVRENPANRSLFERKDAHTS